MTFINKQNIPKIADLKRSMSYRYDSANKQISVDDVDYESIVSVYNETTNKMLYVVGDESLTGTTFRNSVVYNNNVSGVSDSDDLYILYKPVDRKEQTYLLIEIKEELNKLNKIIKKIYN